MSNAAPTLRESIDRLGSFMNRERSIIFSIFTYAIAVGVFSLIIPLTVQELVNTFAFSVSSVMVVTLVGIMAGILFFVGIFRVLQFYATDILERRIFVRVFLSFAEIFPKVMRGRFPFNILFSHGSDETMMKHICSCNAVYRSRI